MVNRSRKTVPLCESRAERGRALDVRARELAELESYLARVRASDRPKRLLSAVVDDDEFMERKAA